MKAPVLSAKEIARLMEIRAMERLIVPTAPDLFDNGRIVAFQLFLDGYDRIGWAKDALCSGEILTAVNSDGDYVAKLMATAWGTIKARSFKRCEVQQ